MDESESAFNEIQALSSQLRLWQYQYYVEARPTVPDSEYDKGFDRLTALEKAWPQYHFEDSPTRRVGSDLSNDFPEVEHQIPVLSLDKAYRADAVLSWCRRVCEKAETPSLSFSLEEKIDGLSIVLYYEKGLLVRAVTRGNGLVGNEVTANVKTIGSVPLRLPETVDVAVRGEIYLPLSHFEAINSRLAVPYANPRNLAAGTLRRVKSSETAAVPLQLFCYEGFFPEGQRFRTHREAIAKLQQLGFRINPKMVWLASDSRKGFDPLSSLGTWIEKRTCERPHLPYEIDGLVLKVNEWEVRERLGYTGHHPRWAVAYKFESPTGESVIQKIDVQVGRTGRMTPVARINPVEISGSVVSNVTLHNQDYINMLNAAPGDTVSVSKRGDVIPAVEQVLEKGECGTAWQMPSYCPACGSPLETEGAHLFCKNNACPGRQLGQLLFFIGRDQMNLEGVGEETVVFLFQSGWVTSIPQLLAFDWNRLLSCPGYGEKKVAALKAGIEAAKTRGFAQVLSSLGFKDLGPKVCGLLIEAGFTSLHRLIGALRRDGAAAVRGIRGIGDKTAEGIVESLLNEEHLRLLEALQALGLQFEVDRAAAPTKTAAWKGQVWCITGSFDRFKPRELAAEAIRRRGASVTSAVSGSTTHLLAGDKPGSKLGKAQALGVRIVTESQFLQCLQEDPIE